jgi:hypothetical protein
MTRSASSPSNTLERWSEDVSEYIAFEIQTRCDIQGNRVPEHIRDFVEEHTRGGPAAGFEADLRGSEGRA